MITVISGIRDIAPISAADVELAVLEEAVHADELRFGGARGVDTIALVAVCGFDIRRVVYVPFRSVDQPIEARHEIRRCADEVIELELRRSRDAYLKRNARMLDGAHRLLAFSDGRETGGTWWTINEARRLGMDVTVVPVTSMADNPPETASRWPLFTYRPYVSGRKGAKDWTSDVVRRMKVGQATGAEIKKLADRLARFMQGEKVLRDSDAIIPMPRRHPRVESDLLPLAEQLADMTGMRVLDVLVREREPSRGTVRAFRVRHVADDHFASLSVRVFQGSSRLIVLDNVMTFGGTMVGALMRLEHDVGGLDSLAGLAILRGTP